MQIQRLFLTTYQKLIHSILRKLKLKFLPRRDGDTSRAVCDTKLMNTIIKFKPKHNSIIKIAKDSLDWEFLSKKKSNG